MKPSHYAILSPKQPKNDVRQPSNFITKKRGLVKVAYNLAADVISCGVGVNHATHG